MILKKPHRASRAILACCLFLLAGCQPWTVAARDNPLAWLTFLGPSATNTPFQALPPVSSPTSSAVAVVNATPEHTVHPSVASRPAETQTAPPTSTAPPPAPTVTPWVLPSPTDAPCPHPDGQIEPQEVQFTPDGKLFAFRVYLPPCYYPGVEARYPVLYIIHGQTYNDDQWDRLGLDEAATEMITAGGAPPFMIVMPLERNTFSDVSTSTFGADLVDGLVPWIDAHYPTCAERDCRAIGGLSRGGAWALRLGFTRWDVFGAIGLHSTPPFIGDPNQLVYWLREIPEGRIPRVYMDTGQSDYWIRSTRAFEQLLTDQAVEHQWHLFEGAHDEAYWSAHIGDYLDWYTAPWQAWGDRP